MVILGLTGIGDAAKNKNRLFSFEKDKHGNCMLCHKKKCHRCANIIVDNLVVLIDNRAS